MDTNIIDESQLDDIQKELTTNTETHNNENSTGSENETTNNNEITITTTQQNILQDIAKIDLELEQLDKTQINEDEFYDTLDDNLTDSEKYLQDENPKEYLKVIDRKKKEFLKSKSNDDKKQELVEKRKELELKNAIEDGLVKVSKQYKDYNHEEMHTFYMNKLNQEEKNEILNTSKSTYDVFRKTYEKYLEKNGKKPDVQGTPAPNTPNFKGVIKDSFKQNIDAIDSEEEKYKKALGV